MFNWLGPPEMHLNIYMKKPKALGTRQTRPLVSGEARYTPGHDPRGGGGCCLLERVLDSVSWRVQADCEVTQAPKSNTMKC
jgi:hypothetical protein